jgi:16S rRNA C967 or C1407 C5-methylase (RsmB/RsmF family)/NOL1/NOP2/fmu family ribosome biogenesis protein
MFLRSKNPLPLPCMPQLPKPFLNSLSHLGIDVEAFAEAHREENRITSIRLNPFKKSTLAFEPGEAVPWTKQAFYLADRPSFTFDPLFHAGCYYVQEAGSMFIEQALKQSLDLSQNLAILDLCAAPGGKSTHINSLITPQSLLVSNELVASRAGVLVQNLSKWGTANTLVTNSDPQKFGVLERFFDAMVVDAPCSGSGLFRKQPEAIEEWSEANVNLCCGRQKKILADALPGLKENGILVYSTCSYSEEENEAIVEWLIKEFEMEFVPIQVESSWGIVETGAGYRFYPHLAKSEGFFCAVLKKPGSVPGGTFRKKGSISAATKAELEVLAPFLEPAWQGPVLKKNNQFHLLNEAVLGFLQTFEKQLYFKKAGVLAGEIKGKDLVPAHELALAIYTGAGVISLELDHETAIRFLKKENLTIPSPHKGLCRITYQDQGIGWAKILPNRINNYLPPEWRILSRQQ